MSEYDDDPPAGDEAGKPGSQVWQQKLAQIEGILKENAPTGRPGAAAPDAPPSRLVWLIRDSFEFEIEAREQTYNGKAWTKGRPLPLDRLYPPATAAPAGTTQQDLDIAAAFTRGARYYRRRGSGDVFNPDYGRLLPALARHPMVAYERYPHTFLNIQIEEPRLCIQQAEDGHTVTLVPPFEDEDIAMIWDSRTQLRISHFSAAHKALARVVGKKLAVPAAATAELAALQTIADKVVRIDSDIPTPGDPVSVLPAADATIFILIEPEDHGLVFRVRVDPSGDGNHVSPGEGARHCTIQKDGQITRLRRDLIGERRRAGELISRVMRCTPDADWEWFFPDPANALAVLADFHRHCGTDAVMIWPVGKPIRIARETDSRQLQIRMEDDGDWFSCAGELCLDDNQTVELTTLLNALGSRAGNFLKLSDRHYIQLTERLRRQLEALARARLDTRNNTTVHLHRAVAIDSDWFDSLGAFKASPSFRSLQQQMSAWQPPPVPTTLTAELRPYQIEGFQWLAQRTTFGFGACLADDMGLGKTVQALAAALLHAPHGPILILAPTSVCGNWLREAHRFAPSLRPRLLGATANRSQALANAGPFDLLICSHGLLPTLKELQHQRWRLVVIDEAQAIKNPHTQRARAVFRLQAQARIATTGTPIENHVGEIWSLFRFLNPGLLGSLDAFRKRYTNIDKAPAERARLQQLIRPFVLRRTKSQVLDDLPPKTEIQVDVMLSPDEAALYEGLRRNALHHTRQQNADNPKGRFSILAEIMRLRRACCHPALVDPALMFPGAKLTALLTIIDDLRDNGHRALVFSQFVDHLAIIRKALADRGILYQYLDGSTPAAARDTAVQAFQAGEGELFLISLKAGGVGLNLTAADYVIHMDPWWNPAVEDQASDRAHRIGQERPVTVYRLIAVGTIEEKILDLHAHKRQLADQLISEDIGGKALSLDDLRQLLQVRTNDSSNIECEGK